MNIGDLVTKEGEVSRVGMVRTYTGEVFGSDKYDFKVSNICGYIEGTLRENPPFGNCKHIRIPFSAISFLGLDPNFERPRILPIK